MMREHPRYPVSLASTMELPDGRSIECLVLDLSMGGAGIETRHEFGDLREFTLRVLEPGFDLKVECEVREIRDLWHRRFISAKFVSPIATAPATDVVELIVAAATTPTRTAAVRDGFLATMRQLFRRRAA